MCVQYFEPHHKFVLVVTIREFFRYLVDTSCGDNVSLSHIKVSSKVGYELNILMSQES